MKLKISINRSNFLILVIVFVALVGVPAANALEWLGPTPYLKAADSPFDFTGFSYGYLEDFEDNLLNTPGVTDSVSYPFGPLAPGGITDSVDADDGLIDGSGTAGHSFFASGIPGITFTFHAGDLGGDLPTHAGIVWTDGYGTITFEAFDAGGGSLGTITGDHADSVFTGTTSEDRFYGVIDMGGISAIKISNTQGGIEVDHLQYGASSGTPPPIPEPTTIVLMGCGLLGLLGVVIRQSNMLNNYY